MPDIFISPTKATLAKIKPDARMKKHPLSSFLYFPDGVDFETKRDDENVILLLRRHPITNIPWIAIGILMLFAPAILNYFPLLAAFPANFQFIAVLSWYLVTTAYILEQFLSWYFNVNIITEERIMDIDFVNIIYKDVTEARIANVQEVNYRMGSVLRTLFNFGDVFIQTASEVPNIEFLAVPKPDKVARVLNTLIEKEEDEHGKGGI